MPSIQRQQTVQTSTALGAKHPSKYAVKNNEKLVSVPKVSQNNDSSESTPAMPQTNKKPNTQASVTLETNGTPAVNRKKQKRREKEAAKRAAASQQTATSINGASTTAAVRIQMQELEARFREQRLDQQYNPEQQFQPADDDPYYSDGAYSGSLRANDSPQNGYGLPSSQNLAKKAKKKKKSKGTQSRNTNNSQSNGSAHNHIGLPLPPLGSTSLPRGTGISKEKIWNTSSQEERERIKEFWLSLGEDERKSLVKVEKNAVLKKMKEQQKHSCSCTVCGRKRTAIEEELEVLYDAYYEELEQYANHRGDAGHPMMQPRRFGAISRLQPPNLLPPAFNPHQPSRGRIVEQLGDDEEDDELEVGVDEEYSEEEGDEEDEYSDDEPEELPRSHAAEFFNFGNSLTVQGGILTVADDLLKNDGKKFIEMMEQLAERRMAREEDAREQFSNTNYGQPPSAAVHPHPHSHNHPPPPPEEEDYDDEEEDEEEEEEEEEEYDSQDEDYDEEEMDTMTEEQRMEEGRRMFQIFAARMFEQRVLTAYKKKVSEERTQRLLEELEEETKAKSEKQAKKARDAQKKKERLAQKKQALAEEKARREAEEAKKLAALRLAEEKKAEEARNRAEEKRKKKEALKKAEEEERLRKEADKARRLQEQRERQAEQERKQREAKEKERKEKDEQRQREKKAKGAKEREAKERKERQDREKLENEAKLKAEKEIEKQKNENLTTPKETVQAPPNAIITAKRASVPVPNNLQPHPIASPHVPIATPAIIKAPTPIKLKASSQQDLNSPAPLVSQSAGLTQNISAPSGLPQENSAPIGPPPKVHNQYPYLHQPQATSPIHSSLKSPPGILSQPNQFGNIQPINSIPFPPGMPMIGPGFGRMQHEPVFPPHQGIGTQFRQLIGPNGMPISMNMHQIPQGRGFPIQHGPPGFAQGIPNTLSGISQSFGVQKDHAVPQSHSRQQSGNIDPLSTPQAQPIARPAPIGRPASVVHGQHNRDIKNDIEDLSNHLGSSALLDDSDEPLNAGVPTRRLSVAPRQNFVPPFGMGQSAFANPITSYGSWGGPQNPFGSSSLPDPGFIGGWPSTGFMVGSQSSRPSQSRPVSVRLMICRACRNLEGTTPDKFIDLNAIKDQVEQMCPPNEPPVTEKEILDICETEGNAINGGGSFDVREDSSGNWTIHYEDETPSHRPLGAPGEIGSPVVGNGGLARFPSTNPPPGF